jgi:hypothetical protein
LPGQLLVDVVPAIHSLVGGDHNAAPVVIFPDPVLERIQG